MALKIHQIANVLHKGMDQVISDLQNLGVNVTKYYDIVQDSDIYDLAVQYGRKEYIFHHISNEFFRTVASSYDEEFLLEYLYRTQTLCGWLPENVAERVEIIRKTLANKAETFISKPIVTKTPKAFHALYLYGVGEKALMEYPYGTDIEVFLIPKTRAEKNPCWIKFNKKDSIVVKLDVENCMLLVWNRGTYLYTTARFKKLGEMYYLNLEEFITLPTPECKNMLKRGVKMMSKYVLPGNCGFATQHNDRCKVIIPQDMVLGRQIKDIWWNCSESMMRMTSKSDIRKAIGKLIMKNGYVEPETFLDFITSLEESLEKQAENHNYEYKRWGMQEYLMYVPEVHIEQTIETTETQDIQMQEACKRLDMLVEQGLAHKVREHFALHKEVYMSECNYGGTTYPIKDKDLTDKIKAFEQQYNALVYHCVNHYDFNLGEMMCMFYVSNHPDQWENERNDIKKRIPIVFVENFEFPDISEFGGIKYRMRDGAIQRYR